MLKHKIKYPSSQISNIVFLVPFLYPTLIFPCLLYFSCYITP